MPRKKKFPQIDTLILHVLNMHYYHGAIAALEHVLKTGMCEPNITLTLETYRLLLANEDPKGDKS